MAKVEENQGGIHRGKVGSLTTYKRLGKYYVRQSIVNSTSNSPAQKKQRSRFKVALENFSPLSQVFKIGFANATKPGATPYNAGISYNMSNAMMNQEGEYVVDWSLVMVSQGKMPNVKEMSIDTNGEDGFMLKWKSNKRAYGAKENDLVCVVWIDTVEKKVGMIDMHGANILRTDEEYAFIPSAHISNNPLAFYAFTMRADGSKVSDSMFVGKIIL